MNQYQLPPDYEAEIDSLRKRQELMQALAMQQFQPRQTQIVSGIAVKQSPLAMGLRALSGVLAQRNAKAAQDEQKGVYSKFQQEGEQELQALQGLSPQEAIVKAMTARGMPARAYGAQLAAQQEAQRKAQEARLLKGTELIGQGGDTSGAVGALNQGQLPQGYTPPPMPPVEYGLHPDSKTPYAITRNRKGEPHLSFTSSEGSTSPIGKLLAERDALPPGDPRRATYDAALLRASTHAPGVSVTYGAPVAGEDPAGNRLFFQPSKSGGTPSIIPGVQPPPHAGAKQTEFEGKATTYASQMASAMKELEKLGGLSNVITQAETALSNTPGGSFITSPQAQQINQAKQQWAEAFLRYKTGAAAPDAEVARNIATFFPRIGESPQAVEQKRRMREQALQDVLLSAGASAKKVQQPTKTAPQVLRFDAQGNLIQ